MRKFIETKLIYVFTTVVLWGINVGNAFAGDDPFGKLTDGLNDHSNSFAELFSSFKPYAYGIAGLIALVGVVQVYGKVQSGDNQATTKMGWWFGGLAFLFLALAIISSIFF